MRTVAAAIIVLVSSASLLGQTGDKPSPIDRARAPQDFNEMRAEIQQLATAQREIAALTGQVVRELKARSEQLDAILEEVDDPLISELWFAFVSDRFTTATSDSAQKVLERLVSTETRIDGLQKSMADAQSVLSNQPAYKESQVPPVVQSGGVPAVPAERLTRLQAEVEALRHDFQQLHAQHRQNVEEL